MGYDSIAKHITIDNPKEDRKGAVRVGKYHLGKQALFLPRFPYDEYIPYAAIKSIEARDGSVHVTGCCAGGVPVKVLVVEFYEDVDKLKKERLIFDWASEIEKMYELLPRF